jgi:hypothetical protein
MNYKLCIFIFPLILGCSPGKKQAFLNEMLKPPIIELAETGLIINTENSIVNSTLLIYSIEKELDLKKKEIILKGFQASGKKFKNEFKISLNKKVLENIATFKIYWVDPDNKKNELKICIAP